MLSGKKNTFGVRLLPFSFVCLKSDDSKGCLSLSLVMRRASLFLGDEVILIDVLSHVSGHIS